FVSTVEHVMAALCGLGVDNCIVEIDGPEAPILDGSAQPFVEAIDKAGIVTLRAARRYFKVLKPVRVTKGEAFGQFRPCERAFDHPLIGRQALRLDVEPEKFRREISRARTFGFMRDVEKLWSAGYALGASLENTLVVTDDRVLNPGGLRYPDEFVRHKVLDAIGDLALAGAPIIGAYRSFRGAPRLNHAVLAALLGDSSAWTVVEERAPARPVRGGVSAASTVEPALGLALPLASTS